MSYQFAVSPDIHARELSTWFVFNTRLQRLTGQAFHATMYDGFEDLHRAIADGKVDLIYANAADTASLVRERGFVPVARARNMADESMIVVSAESPFRTIHDLVPGLVAAATDAPDVERICRILLEPADLGRDGLRLSVKRNYILVAKAVASGEADMGFFLKAAHDELSQTTKRLLRPLIASKIYLVGHSLLASPAIAPFVDVIAAGLEALSANPEEAEFLTGLGAPQGWQRLSMDDVDFLIDLMAALES